MGVLRCRDGLYEALDDNGVALAEEVGEGALVAYEDVGEEVGYDELHLGGGGGGVGNAALEDEAAEAEPVLGGVGGELGEGVGGGDVEDKLVLEIAEDDDDESGDAAKGEGVGPEAPVLELPGACADVNARPGGVAPGGGGGEMAEEGVGQQQRRRRRRGGVGVEGSGADEGGEAGSEARGENSRGHGRGGD